ncbi:MAG: type II toxin-antitoxin system RelB/DinJ family antitoxin [Oscillospiraceae bacterium]|nr:type II toxin-antitoxin system RelB/DinJ family antitoxin [Oscillospiraceae bacterium]
MAQATFSVRMDETLKRQFDALCEDFGMSATTAFTIFARAVVRERRIPFPIQAGDETPNAETVAALEEGAEMLRNPAKYKRYATFREAMDEVLNDA